MLLTRCLSPEEAYRQVEWKVLILIGALLSLGAAMEASGAGKFLAQQLIAVVGANSHYALLSCFFILTVALTQPMSNQAAALVVFPIAMQTGLEIGVDPRAFGMMVAVAASCSYLTPLEPSCLMVYGPGKYQFSDFFKVGAPLTLVIYAIAILMVPWVWPLSGLACSATACAAGLPNATSSISPKTTHPDGGVWPSRCDVSWPRLLKPKFVSRTPMEQGGLLLFVGKLGNEAISQPFFQPLQFQIDASHCGIVGDEAWLRNFMCQKKRHPVYCWRVRAVEARAFELRRSAHALHFPFGQFGNLFSKLLKHLLPGLCAAVDAAQKKIVEMPRKACLRESSNRCRCASDSRAKIVGKEFRLLLVVPEQVGQKCLQGCNRKG